MRVGCALKLTLRRRNMVAVGEPIAGLFYCSFGETETQLFQTQQVVGSTPTMSILFFLLIAARAS